MKTAQPKFDTEKVRSNLETILKQADKLSEAILFNLPQEAGESVSIPLLWQQRDPIATARQQQLWWFYEIFGVIGLALMIRRIAREEMKDEITEGLYTGRKRKRPARQYNDDGYAGNSEPEDSDTSMVGGSSDDQNAPSSQSTAGNDHDRELSGFTDSMNTERGGHTSWNTIVKDIALGPLSRTIFYLCSLSPRVIPALIEGSLPSKLRDPEFSRACLRHLRLRNTQGVYTVFVAATNPDRNSQPSDDTHEHVGKGLTLAQLRQVTDAMRKYIDVKDTSKEAIDLAKKIDCQRGSLGSKINYKKQRLYGGGVGKDNFTKHKYWVERVDEIYLDWAKRLREQEPQLPISKHLQRCFAYVGLSGNVLTRAPRHWTGGSSESPLFGLFAATTEMLFGDDYSVEEFTYQILKTTRVEDIGLDEIIISILTSSFLWDGGLNFTHAGSSRGRLENRNDPNFDQQNLQANAESIQRSGLTQTNVEHATTKVEKVQKALEFDRDPNRFRAREVQANQELKVVLMEFQSQLEKLEASTDYAMLLEAAGKDS